tara:strand:+ start:1717 stop:2499 length:783 start_codon:yes stop_codon:yes gene_type:complete
MILTHNIDPIIFSIGSINFYWYGAMYAVSFLVIDYLMRTQYFLKSITITKKEIDSLLIILIVAVIIGGRLGYVLFYNFDYYLSQPIKILYIWEGGMSFHGALLMIIFSLFYFSTKSKIQFLMLSDYIVLFVPIGLFLGRIGNFINSELYGIPTTSTWGIIFPMVDDLPRHPSMLYEAFFEGVVLYSVIIYFYRKKLIQGSLTAIFLFFYGIFRFFIEFLRVPDAHIGYLWDDWFTMGQLLSIPMIIAGILIFIVYRERTL